MALRLDKEYCGTRGVMGRGEGSQLKCNEVGLGTTNHLDTVTPSKRYDVSFTSYR